MFNLLSWRCCYSVCICKMLHNALSTRFQWLTLLDVVTLLLPILIGILFGLCLTGKQKKGPASMFYL